MQWIEIVRYTLSGLGYLLIFISLLPLIRSSWWLIRIFDYPRSQKFWINLVIVVLYLIVVGIERTADLIFLAAIFLNQLYLCSQIWNYTRLAPIQMKSKQADRGEAIRLLVANVFQDNRDVNRCHAHIRSCDPDLILFVETDQWWVDSMAPFEDTYPYRIAIPLDNTYGMLLFSKLKIIKGNVRNLVESDVPSITADILTKGGNLFRLYALHPNRPYLENPMTPRKGMQKSCLLVRKRRNARIL